jgi:hypothetical protein
MAKTCFFAAPTNSSDVLFRAWGKALSDAMTAVGFVKTADTGQIDWATVLAPTSVTYQGYEIRQFTDALQSTNPVFVKIEYGSYSLAADPCLKISIGVGSDGSGNLTGDYSSYMHMATHGSNTTTLSPCIVSGDTNRIEVAMFIDATVYNISFFIERVKDDSGNDSDDGIDLIWQSNAAQGNAGMYQRFFPKKGLPYPLVYSTGVCCLLPYTTVNNYSYSGNIGIYPTYTNMGYVANPNLALCIYNTAVINSVGSVITLTIFGEEHDYMLTSILSGTINGNTNAGICIAVRYE